MPRPPARPASRIAQAVLATWVALALAITLAPPTTRAGDTTTTDPGRAAAGWLAEQLATDPTIGPGSLADAIFAFAATGAGQDAAVDALARLESGLEAFVTDGTTVFPGPLAKAMLAVAVQGADVHDFGGRDLEADLRALLVTTGTDAGRFGTASVLDQALAILALARTTDGVPAPAATWLVAAQCPSGEYAWDGSCPAGPGTEDPDTTGFALQALLAAGETVAADSAVAWLADNQDTGGGFVAFATPNTNSSGVAGQAMRAAGETASADAAAAFVVSLQFGCDAADPTTVGAIGWAVGISGFLVFSTPQAVLALGAPPLDELSVAGAAPDAPTFECTSAPASPTPTASPSEAESPSGGGGGGGEELPDTATSTEPDASIALFVLVGLGVGMSAGWARRRSNG